ncbi:MAG: hypothetical protein CVV13_08250 [Gammaproteobacteria bacterium HGW-Gammaproteobacteria-3]|nr:MAG: hypothetical protein CVV13_08250 [Gammaproteobacteria bacterium HGW-Gammaproteobacteria-3]
MLFLPRLNNRLLAVVLCFSSPGAYADTLTQAIDIDLATTEAAVDTQKKIDRASARTQKMLEDYRAATRHTETLRTYNDYLKNLHDSLLEEKNSLQQQLGQIEVTQREIIPLIMSMLNSLEQFIKLDLPFLPEERQQRLAHLKQMISRADVTEAEKFRRILEAYQIENDYGNSIEAYRAEIDLNGSPHSVDFLRLGRLALYYQRLDGSQSGFWNKASGQWETLDSDYRNAIRQGLRIARKEAAPDLLTLPIAAPEVGQ